MRASGDDASSQAKAENAALAAELANAVAGEAAAKAANATNAAALADAEATVITKNAELETSAAALAEATAAKETCEALICDGLFVDACPAEKYLEGRECADCPAGHMCDGVTATYLP